jgi:hypothetical protein|tara:strand:+ start:9838 stop:10572 length:735 start_codon:yes stop_codon:yes gene_type:complete
MAYQKLQVSSALDVIPSNTVDIPNPTSALTIMQETKTAEGAAGTSLLGISVIIDFSTTPFINVEVGDKLTNLTTLETAIVTIAPVAPYNGLFIDKDIMPTSPGSAPYKICSPTLLKVSSGDFSVAGTLTLPVCSLATTAGILPGAIVYNTGGSVAYTITSVVSATELAISPVTAAGATDAFQIYNEATDAAVLYSGGAAQNIKLTMASNTVDTFKGVPTGAYLPLQVKRVWGTSSAPTDIIALW